MGGNIYGSLSDGPGASTTGNTVTNSGTVITSVVTVTARTGTRPDGTPEISAILVPPGTPGFTVEPAYDKLGIVRER